ncbi:MAG: aspartyl/asparaginyl beta-hydroxylase domain-containing protein [Bdellovibrionaceae bacterium]|nr:aspartyl/asparaginyl beta-hydroxylase domain-containing protein [Pseudobdellovibrionaceae bacterium]
MVVLTILVAALAFVIGSLLYVYKYRGKARFDSFNEYVRKGWPIFSPLNCLLYMFTEKRASKPIMDVRQFPELKNIQDNWQTIKKEVMNLHEKGYFEMTKKPDAGSYYDLGFRTFYKYGWSKFYLKWYGYTHTSAQTLCPETVKILKTASLVNGAMFSILPPGSQLTRHLDPVACSLRYHLGLSTPNDDKCYIDVDTETYSWRDGDALLFDETYLHFVRNDSDKYRLILMCDVERPMSFPGKFVNFIYKGLMRFTVVPNTEVDKRGLVNTIFSSLSPIFQKTKTLKQTNRPLYLTIKYTVNLTLIVLLVTILAASIQALHSAYTYLVL